MARLWASHRFEGLNRKTGRTWLTNMAAIPARHPSFDIDVHRLEERYKQLQREFHPDKFATASSTEQEYSARYASLINEGYAMLKQPLQRARLLVS